MVVRIVSDNITIWRTFTTIISTPDQLLQTPSLKNSSFLYMNCTNCLTVFIVPTIVLSITLYRKYWWRSNRRPTILLYCVACAYCTHIDTHNNILYTTAIHVLVQNTNPRVWNHPWRLSRFSTRNTGAHNIIIIIIGSYVIIYTPVSLLRQRCTVQISALCIILLYCGTA